MRNALTFGLALLLAGGAGFTPRRAAAQGIGQRNVLSLPGAAQKEALRVNDHIYQATGFGNTYLITTREGNVIVDTSNSSFNAAHRKLLRAVSEAPVRYIILTHAHPDHVGGIRQWREPETQVIAHANYPLFRDYQRRLKGLHDRRAAAQYNLSSLVTQAASTEYLGPPYDASITFEREHEFKLGELTFQLHYAPGETQDQIALWIPELKTAFLGDNLYETFPNIYTLRGTEFRSPVLWIQSLEMVRGWKPEILLGSHILPIVGQTEVERRLTHYVDAIHHVHDQTVAGMNAGKDVYTLMHEIRLPEELAINERYGRLTWSIRGIYEGYVGWFDERAVTMSPTPPWSVHNDLVQLAGGAANVVARAKEHHDAGRLTECLHLLEVVLQPEPRDAAALQLRIDTLKLLSARTENVIELAWLEEFIRRDQKSLARLKSS